MFASCDLVIVEGDAHTAADKIEVWRAAQGDAPLATADAKVLAMVTDDSSDVKSCLQIARSPLDELIAWIVGRYLAASAGVALRR